MNDANEKDNLTEGWPEENGNEELAEFARQVRANLPELPPEAMQRVHGGMRLRTSRRPVYFWRVLAGMAAAAAIGIGVGVWRFHSRDPAPYPKPPTVQDTYVIQLPAPHVTVPDRPLLKLSDYASLLQTQPSQSSQGSTHEQGMDHLSRAGDVAAGAGRIGG